MPAKLDEWTIKTPQVYDSEAIFLIFQLNKYFSGRIGAEFWIFYFTQIQHRLIRRFFADLNY
jgi:hypothetical protein